MKRSELTMTGETYRLTPTHWGETSIMVDEDAVAEITAEAFDIPVEECDPDSDPNDTPETVDIAKNDDGNFYAILHPFRAGGKWHNENLYRPCDDPGEPDNGSVSIHGKWMTFDDET